MLCDNEAVLSMQKVHYGLRLSPWRTLLSTNGVRNVFTHCIARYILKYSNIKNSLTNRITIFHKEIPSTRYNSELNLVPIGVTRLQSYIHISRFNGIVEIFAFEKKGGEGVQERCGMISGAVGCVSDSRERYKLQKIGPVNLYFKFGIG